MGLGTSPTIVAIDPLAMILTNDAYLRWVEIHHPRAPKVDEIREAMAGMSTEERDFVRARVRTLGAFVKAVDEAAEAVEKAA
jgi:hypothetical protein